jgi:hypothetical protein
MGQTFLWFAMPLAFTIAAKVAVPAIRPLGHSALPRGVFCTGCLRHRAGEGVSDAHSG